MTNRIRWLIGGVLACTLTTLVFGFFAAIMGVPGNSTGLMIAVQRTIGILPAAYSSNDCRIHLPVDYFIYGARYNRGGYHWLYGIYPNFETAEGLNPYLMFTRSFQSPEVIFERMDEGQIKGVRQGLKGCLSEGVCRINEAPIGSGGVEFWVGDRLIAPDIGLISVLPAGKPEWLYCVR